VASYDLTKPLVIDPVLVYSTYLGGNGTDYTWTGDIAVDSIGNAYAAGLTLSTDFPTANALQATLKGSYDAFVTKLNAAGSALVYSTYLGGNAEDIGGGIAVDSTGNAYITGYTNSTDFPTANALQATLKGSYDAFVTKLNAAGSALVYSTYLGGNSIDTGYAIAVDSTGNAYITGYTNSTNFSTANALQATLRGSSDAFVTKISSDAPVPVPTGLTATVGDAAVYLKWASPVVPVDGYNIFVERLDNVAKQFISLGTVNPAGVLIQNTSFKVLGFANGQLVENSELYRFTVQAVENGVGSGFSNPVLARPNEFAVGQIPPQRDNPILFLHGIGFPLFPVDARTWETTKDYLEEQLGWRFGCELVNVGQPILTNFESIVIEARNCEPAGFAADFFTVTFGNDSANYADGRGILHQADEVGAFVSTLLTERSRLGLPFQRLSLVAHSMGGLAARSYLATTADAARNQIFDLITYGTPHAGAPRASFGQIFSDGARDMEIDCISGARVNSPFLLDLRTKRLPDIRYFGILGHIQSFVGYAVEHQSLSGCFSIHWDGVVTIDSVDWSDVVVPHRPQLLTTTRGHVTEETSDFSAILCALNPNCFVLEVHSPIEVEVTGPDGNSMAVDLAEIPGATYTELNDEIGHSTAFVVIPFPLPGAYVIKVVPKKGAKADDTYSLQVTQNATTTMLAENQAIQNIPAQGYTVNVPLIVNIDIKPGPGPNCINPTSKGTTTVAILATGVDVTMINVGTLEIGGDSNPATIGLRPVKTSYNDVDGDGKKDVVLQFDTPQLNSAALLSNGKTLFITGQLADGTQILGSDVIFLAGGPNCS
jgi:pimeloyl-ACP methyl ester carboxylesterase